MTEARPDHDATPPEADGKGAETTVRLWPAVAIVSVQISLTLATMLLGASTFTGLLGYALAPLLGAAALAIWWLFASKVPIKSRIAGIVSFAAVLALLSSDYRMLIPAIPAVTITTVLMLLITRSTPWSRRRWLALVPMIVCALVFSALRVDGVHGSLFPELSWKWEPTSESQLAAGTSSTSNRTAEIPGEVTAQDWPGFRGPNRDGVITGVSFSTDWKANPPKEIWRRPVGIGWSSFTVIGDYLFTQEQRGDTELVVCYAADTGEEIWTNQIPGRFNDPMGGGPRATPTFSEGKLYTQGATGILQSLDAATGESLWKRDLREDTGAGLPTWGFSSSPTVIGALVIAFPGAGEGKGVAAYNKDSGDPVWTAGEGTHGYSSGHFASVQHVPQLLMSSNYGIQAFAPETGDLLWEDVWDIQNNPRVVQPIVVDDGNVIAGTGQGKGARLLSVYKDGATWNAKEEWTSDRFRPYFNDLVYHNGHCYGFDGNRFTCIDASTGARAWRGKKLGGQVILVADMNALLVLSEAGDVILIEASPEAYKEIGRFRAIDGKTWNHPVIAHGKLYVRNDQEAAAFNLPNYNAM